MSLHGPALDTFVRERGLKVRHVTRSPAPAARITMSAADNEAARVRGINAAAASYGVPEIAGPAIAGGVPLTTFRAMAAGAAGDKRNQIATGGRSCGLPSDREAAPGSGSGLVRPVLRSPGAPNQPQAIDTHAIYARLTADRQARATATAALPLRQPSRAAGAR